MKKRIISLILVLILSVIAISSMGCNKKKNGDPENDMYLTLVNKNNTVSSEYVPSNLVTLDTSYTTGGKSIELEATTANAVKAMIDAMKKDGITNVTVTSGYRTYRYQKTLFDRYCAEEKAAHPSWSDAQVSDFVATYSAYPGTSEHQTGLCVDLFTSEMAGLWNYGSETPGNPYDKGFAETEAYEWLKAHAHEYGFILRFPEDKTHITGYSYESWHYRYVGAEHAKKIKDAGATLEEYIASRG